MRRDGSGGGRRGGEVRRFGRKDQKGIVPRASYSKAEARAC